MYGTEHEFKQASAHVALAGGNMSTEQMTDQEIIHQLAVGVMEWDEIPADWNPLTQAAHSKMIREKLAKEHNEVAIRIFNDSVGEYTPKPGEDLAGVKYHCSIWDIGLGKVRAEANTEERAVALCALKLKQQQQEKGMIPS